MTAETKDGTEQAEKQAKAQLDSIRELMERVQHIDGCPGGEDCTARDADILSGLNLWREGLGVTEDEREQYHDEDEARQRIDESPLSVEVRSDWHSPGDESEDAEFRILLCTGGPAVQIVGSLGTFSEPDGVRLQYQDWFTPWADAEITANDEETLLSYARAFYYGT